MVTCQWDTKIHTPKGRLWSLVSGTLKIHTPKGRLWSLVSGILRFTPLKVGCGHLSVEH